jgi:hypothetical protein
MPQRKIFELSEISKIKKSDTGRILLNDECTGETPAFLIIRGEVTFLRYDESTKRTSVQIRVDDDTFKNYLKLKDIKDVPYEINEDYPNRISFRLKSTVNYSVFRGKDRVRENNIAWWNHLSDGCDFSVLVRPVYGVYEQVPYLRLDIKQLQYQNDLVENCIL